MVRVGQAHFTQTFGAQVVQQVLQHQFAPQKLVGEAGRAAHHEDGALAQGLLGHIVPNMAGPVHLEAVDEGFHLAGDGVEVHGRGQHHVVGLLQQPVDFVHAVVDGAALLVPAVAAVLAGGNILRAVGVDDGVLAAQGIQKQLDHLVGVAVLPGRAGDD